MFLIDTLDRDFDLGCEYGFERFREGLDGLDGLDGRCTGSACGDGTAGSAEDHRRRVDVVLDSRPGFGLVVAGQFR